MCRDSSVSRRQEYLHQNCLTLAFHVDKISSGPKWRLTRCHLRSCFALRAKNKILTQCPGCNYYDYKPIFGLKYLPKLFFKKQKTKLILPLKIAPSLLKASPPFQRLSTTHVSSWCWQLRERLTCCRRAGGIWVCWQGREEETKLN